MKKTLHRNLPALPQERRLTAAQFQALANVPPEAEWFANRGSGEARRAYHLLRRAIFVMVARLTAVSVHGQEKAAGLVFIECTIYVDGNALDLPIMFYVDEHGKRLLDRRKQPFGTMEYWTTQSIRVMTAGVADVATGKYKVPPLVFSLDRLTGTIKVYTKESPIESMLQGKCDRKAAPTPKF